MYCAPKGLRYVTATAKLKLLARHGVEMDETAFKPQLFSLTIPGPKGTVPVYDEMAQIVRDRFQAQNLAIRSLHVFVVTLDGE